MKKNYFGKMCLLAIFCLLGNFVMAQGVWKVNNAVTKSVTPTLLDEKGIPGSIFVGYTGPDAYIYPYDGLSIDRDARVGVAIKLPREKFAPYIGGKLAALYVGWDTEDMNGQVETFVRTSFDGEDLAKGKGEVAMGWNRVNFEKSLSIPDVDTLVLGFYTELKANVIAIPKVYPIGQPYSCYLWMEGDKTPEGKEFWVDARDFGTMTLLGIIDDEEGKFNNMLQLDKTCFDRIVSLDSISTAFVTITNKGSNVIESLEVTSQFGDKTWSMEVPFNKGVACSTTGRVFLPYVALGSGSNKYSISKVNGVEVEKPQSVSVNLIAIPTEVSERYKMNHLMEFWTSENSYAHITYFEMYTRPYLEKYADRVTFVNQHTDDQFMTGENDDVAQMMLDFVDNDSMAVYIPSLSLNRNRYVNNRASNDYGPLFPVFYPEYGDLFVGSILDSPTFANISVEGEWTGDKKAKVVVKGNVAEGIMPKDEPLYLTVYLMEYGVETDSQIFWDENQEEEYGGKYNHYNIIRQILTPVYGEKLAKTGGDFSQTFEVDVDEYWDASKLSVIAFLNRGVANDKFERQVINSCEKKLDAPTGIESVENNNVENQQPVAIYNMAGVRVDKFNGKGIYLVKSMNNGQPVIRKVLVK